MNEHNQSMAWRSATEQVPRHVAIIMDGNGRWAERRGLPRSVGHRMGVEAVRRTVRAAIELGIQHLTIYSFSSENWSRPASEIDDLMGLMKRFIRRDLAELHQNGVRISVIGEREGVDAELLGMIDEAVSLTCENLALNLMIAFNYGSRAEIAKAARVLAERVEKGTLKPEEITPELLASVLDTHGVPDPDLLIRTSGELRLSNFLLWQAAYTEFVFLDAYWPDFGRELLEQAIGEFHKRNRRFGGVATRSTG
ncbi:MAG: isoprenyl transferase [Hyphomicrobiaceae bacterium]|nr:MAG: isoprenyl transferase [Hyphomicrobiaceae bacterium]